MSVTDCYGGLPEGDNAWLLRLCTELRSYFPHPLSLWVSIYPSL